MKKIISALAIAMFGYCAGAQTNTFPSSGNVGIGTTGPSLPLHVNGTIYSASPESNTVGIGTSWANDANYNFVGYQGYWGLRTATNNSYSLDVYNGGSPITAMTILQAGNVGIGTSAPAAKLHVFGVSVLAGSTANIDPHGPAVDPNVLANTGQMLIGWNREGAPGETDFISNQGAGSIGGFAFYNHDNNNNETQLMWIQGNGNVAIGTKDPKGYKLAVNGSAIATSITVKVNSNWPDYVFKKEYQLPSLAEVKTYIDQNQHLPDLPSEQEVIKDGINLGEMNKLLTKKVEELTLYLIDKDKQVMQLQDKVKQLQRDEETRIAALEAALAKLTASK